MIFVKKRLGVHVQRMLEISRCLYSGGYFKQIIWGKTRRKRWDHDLTHYRIVANLFLLKNILQSLFTSLMSLHPEQQNRAATRDFQQFYILTSVDSDEPLQPPVKLRNSKWCSVSSITIIEFSSDEQRLWSDCVYAQADLRLCWSHIPHCWKSHALAQLLLKVPAATIVHQKLNGAQQHWIQIHLKCKPLFNTNFIKTKVTVFYSRE